MPSTDLSSGYGSLCSSAKKRKKGKKEKRKKEKKRKLQLHRLTRFCLGTPQGRKKLQVKDILTTTDRLNITYPGNCCYDRRCCRHDDRRHASAMEYTTSYPHPAWCTVPTINLKCCGTLSPMVSTFRDCRRMVDSRAPTLALLSLDLRDDDTCGKQHFYIIYRCAHFISWGKISREGMVF